MTQPKKLTREEIKAWVEKELGKSIWAISPVKMFDLCCDLKEQLEEAKAGWSLAIMRVYEKDAELEAAKSQLQEHCLPDQASYEWVIETLDMLAALWMKLKRAMEDR